MANILIVDDVKFTSLNLKNILNRVNFQDVVIKHNIDESLDYFIEHEKEIKVIFLSIVIEPSENIESCIELIKKFKFFNDDIKIIIIATNEDKQKVLKAIQHGALDFINKPLKETKVQEILKKINI